MYAWALDKLKDERERGISIDSKIVSLQSAGFAGLSLIDTPGEKAYTKNLIRGLSQADTAVLLINATSWDEHQYLWLRTR